jgi:Tfp pilus assembly protein PilO
MTLDEVVSYVTTVVLVPVAGWVVKINSGQTKLETAQAAQKELFDTKMQSQSEILERIEHNLDYRLERIERALNGYLKGVPHD